MTDAAMKAAQAKALFRLAGGHHMLADAKKVTGDADGSGLPPLGSGTATSGSPLTWMLPAAQSSSTKTRTLWTSLARCSAARRRAARRPRRSQLAMTVGVPLTAPQLEEGFMRLLSSRFRFHFILRRSFSDAISGTDTAYRALRR